MLLQVYLYSLKGAFCPYFLYMELMNMNFNVYKGDEFFGQADGFYSLAILIIPSDEEFVSKVIELKDKFYLANVKGVREIFFEDYRIVFA